MESMVKEGSIGSVLFKSRIITEDHIRLALEEQRASGCRFGEALVKLGIVAQEDIDWALSNQLNIPYVRLSEEIIDRTATRLVPADIARKYNLIPIIRTGDDLHIALADPMNKAAVDAVERITGCRVTISMPILRELREVLDLYYGPAVPDASFGFLPTEVPTETLDGVNADTSGSALLEHLLSFFLREGITSLSLQPVNGFVRIMSRGDTGFNEIGRFPVGSYTELLHLIRKQSGIEGEHDPAAQGTLAFRYLDSDLEFGVFLVKALGGDCVTFKIHRNEPFPTEIRELEMEPEAEESLHALAAGRGMVLFASRNYVDRCRFMDLFLDEGGFSGKNVLLLGEGIGKGKALFPRIPHPETSPEELEQVVTALLDHDPDVIVLEDVTDSRSFLAAWKAAMRGCLVVAGISCNGLDGAVDYLLLARRVNLSVIGAISGILAISGLRILCPRCRESRPVIDGSALPATDTYYRSRGCPACAYSGSGGVKYLVDVIQLDHDLREALATVAEGSEFLALPAGKGYRSIADRRAGLLRAGEISPEEFLASREC